MKYLLTLLSLVFTSQANATEFSVNTLKFIDQMNAGETKTFMVKILNPTKKEIKVDFLIRELVEKDGGGIDVTKINEDKVKPANSLRSFAKTPETVVTIKPGETVKVPLIVTLPIGFKGTGGLSFTVKENDEFEKINGKLGISIQKRWTGYVVISEKSSSKMAIEYKSLEVKGTLTELKIQNVGSAMADFSGFIIIVDAKGKQVSRVPLFSRKNTSNVSIFPGNHNYMLATIKLDDPKKYKYLVTVKNDKQKFIFSKEVAITDSSPAKNPVKSTKK